MPNIQLFGLLWAVFTFLVNGAMAVYLYWDSRNRVTEESLKKLSSDLTNRIGELEQRVTTGEAVDRLGPTHEDLKELRASMTQLTERLADTTGQFKAVRDQLALINQHLVGKALS